MSAGVSGAVVLWNADRERASRRKELLLTAAKDLALEEHRTQREKFKVIFPLVPLVAEHYKELKHLIDNDAISPELQKKADDSANNPKVKKALVEDGIYPGMFLVDENKHLL